MRKNKKIKKITYTKTILRGYLHMFWTPFVIANGITCMCFASTFSKTVSVAIFMGASIILFGMSGIYHVFNWSDNVKAILRRFDHMNIFLLIAGTYTPLGVSLLPLDHNISYFESGFWLLVSIWTMSLLALIIHCIWIKAPRGIYVIAYILTGCFAIFYIPAFLKSSSDYAIYTTVFISIGGLIYIIGALFYAFKFPLKRAKIYGFHELFHTCTIIAYTLQCTGVWFAVLN